MTDFFEGLSFMWMVGGMAVLAAAFGLWAFMAFRKLDAVASADWDYLQGRDMQDLRLTKSAYVKVYRKVNAPRFSLYMAGGAALILLLTPIAFGLINLALWGVWKFSGESRVFEPGYLVWAFSIFFCVIGVWALIGAFVARLYHAKGPGLMRDELIAERQNFVPTERLTVGANPVHIQANATSIQAYHDMLDGALALERTIDKNWNGTGVECHIYSDGSGMQICVHNADDNQSYSEASHPFFFHQPHAREEAEPIEYTMIMKIQGARAAFEKIVATGLAMEKKTGSANSTLHSFRHNNVSVFLYEA